MSTLIWLTLGNPLHRMELIEFIKVIRLSLDCLVAFGRSRAKRNEEEIYLRQEQVAAGRSGMEEQHAVEADAQDAPNPPTEEQANRDEENCYTAVPWSELIMPVDFIDRQRFAVAFSGTVRNAWVKQTAPACAAASVASALNYVLKLERTSETAFTQEGVIELYKSLVADKINLKLSKLGRVADADVNALKMFLSQHMKDVTGRTSKKLIAEVKEALRGLPKEDKLRWFVESPCNAKQCDDEMVKNENEDDPSCGNKEAKQTLFELVRQMRGLAKLSLTRPSTGHIGNLTLKQAVARISSTLPASLPGLKAETFMGKGKAQHKVKPKDREEDISRQWKELWAAYVNPNVALIMHLTNHYALVYALREWTTQEGQVVRQLLTARKGQTPKAWLEFDECRAMMIRWKGYAIIRITTMPQITPDSAA